jgi:hypothetical protein
MYDEPSKTEHFVREIAFKHATAPFGFVVPTPSLPVVTRVEDRPFAALDSVGFRSHQGLKMEMGAGWGTRRGPVDVVSTQQIGSFTVFVLASDDAGALESWLGKHGFTTTPASKVWLDHYVALKFFHVAFRYAPRGTETEPGDRRMASEAIDISFKTPRPYYPYREPDLAMLEDQRLVSLWFVSQEAMEPVAAVRQGEQVTWKRPFLEGDRPAAMSRAALATLLGPKLSPLLPTETSSPLVVQVFEDEKTSRRGYGDILFVPEHPRPEEQGEDVDSLRALYPVLDPGLEGAQ